MGGNFTKLEREAVEARLMLQIDDSAKSKITSPVFFIDRIKTPLRFDTGFASASAGNMAKSMFALGFYRATATYDADTARNNRVTVRYEVDAGKRTLIDTFVYRLSDSALQNLALLSQEESVIQPGNPITKAAVLGEVARLVDTFRNNGYFKITAAELRMRGDTSIAALTQISNDPFEQLELLNQSQQALDSPTIRLQMVINPTKDSTKLMAYTINDIYVMEDYRPGDRMNDSTSITQRRDIRNEIYLRYHKKYVRTRLLKKNILFKKGDLYNQEKYYATISKLSRIGVWDRVNVRTEETDTNKLNLFLELLPAKKYGFETSIEASYSSSSVSSNPLGSNLFGVAANVSLSNRNIAKEAINMTHTLRAGIELSSGNGRNTGGNIVNSNELTYTNSIVFPSRKLFPRNILRQKEGESFINSRLSTIRRISLFDLNSLVINQGTVLTLARQKKLTIRPFNFELNYLNKTDSFQKIIDNNLFLRYSYTTSFILGISATYTSTYNNPRHLKSDSKERFFKVNFEESGLTYGALPVFKKYKSKFAKADVEYKYTVTKPKSALVFRAFAGVGIPVAGDTSLPFFKQYFGGGSNSMRAWPVRGIGRGSQPLAGFGTIFNDRTGDIQIESNVEYRYPIARIIPNTLTLRGAVFTDIGNIWNFNGRPGVMNDPAQFKFSKLYKELGVDVGTGFRLDFNYAIVRIDLGFRIKRPETSNINSGWKLPDFTFADVFPKLFTRGTNDENRKWRYENFNLTFGINYPF